MVQEQVRLSDIVTFLLCVRTISKHRTLDLHDANQTVDQLMNKLDRKVLIGRDVLQSALYAASMLDEVGKFEHPLGLTFHEFVKGIVGRGKKFDKKYHLIVEDKDYEQ